MLIDLLSTSNYVSYNVKLAELLGLHPAIYLSELMSVNDKAINKGKITDGYFTLVRSYIKDRTTIDETEQLDIETNLAKIGILQKGETEDSLCLNINTIVALLTSTDEALIDKVKKIKKERKPRKTKAEAIRDNLKKSVSASNEELKEAYCCWIDAVLDRQGWMSAKCVSVAEKTVDEFSHRNLDVALQLLEIAAVNGYRDIQWAINVYNKQYNVSYKVSTSPKRVITSNTQLSEEVF